MTTDHAAGAPTPWLKARASSDTSACVEMRRHGAVVEVRDSKDPHGPVLSLAPGQFTAWLEGADKGEFARLTR
jgi:hypothetical protein